MRLEDILKAAGWTDADLESIKPMLENAKFRASMEQQYGAAKTAGAAERDAAWQKQLDEEWNPRVSAAEKQAQEARIALAQAQEKLKIAKDYGYLTEEAEAKAEVAAAAKKLEQATGEYITKSDFENGYRTFAEAEGRAIAMAHDIAAEYSYLTGGRSIFEYEGQNGMRGMQALREEAKTSRLGLDQYVAQKFDFAGKRQALAQKKQQEHDDAIVKATEERIRGEYVKQNPLLAMPMPSRQPFIPGKSGADGKQPWERGTQQERRAERVTRLTQTQMSSSAVH